MSPPKTRHAESPIAGQSEELRPHVYDGIHEYNKRLPNWWLWTFYVTIYFSIAYWFIIHQSGGDFTQETQLAAKIAEVQARAAALATGPLTEDQLWALAGSKETVTAGRNTYVSTCASCHGTDLKGGIGVNLVDTEWIHGSSPNQILKVINEGVAAKGMPAWSSVLGRKRIQEVLAYVLSHHEKPETTASGAVAAP